MKSITSMLIFSWLLLLAQHSFCLDNGYEAGTEFQINTYTTSNQYLPALASDGSISYMILWTSLDQDGDSEGIFGQLLSRHCLPASSELQINQYTTSTQRVAAISSDGSGYMAVWSSNYQDGSYQGVFGRGINNDGSFSTTEFSINTYTTGYQDYPSIASNNSNYLVVWDSSDDQDGHMQGIFGRILLNDGTKIGSEFQINTYTTASQTQPVAACDGMDYLVVWQSDGQDGSTLSLFGQILDNDGTKIGSEFQVNSYTTGEQLLSAIASNGSGYFVVWISQSGQDGSLHGIFGQILDNDGTKIGSEIQINTYTSLSQYKPSVACNGMDYLVVWQSLGQDGDGYGVYGQFFDSAGAKIGSEFQINSHTTGHQNSARVTAMGGGFLVAWTSGDDQDGNDKGVFAKYFTYTGIGITTNPQSQTVYEGDSVTFNVTASSHHGTLQYQWYKNGDPVGTQSSLTLSNVLLSDNDSVITCVVSDGLDVAATPPVTLNVLPVYRLQVETLVSSYANATSSKVSAVSDGLGYFLVWHVPVVPGYDNDIVGQFFDSDASKVGTEFKINTYTTSYQGNAKVATNGDNYLVVWQSLEQDCDGYGVYGQLLDSGGAKIGSEFQVHTYTAHSQIEPCVASDGSNYIVAWETYATPKYGIYAQYFTGDGTKLFSELQVTSTMTALSHSPEMAFSGDRYLVVWNGAHATLGNNEIYGQLLGVNGTKIGSEFRVNQDTTDYQLDAAVAYIGSEFMVCWQSCQPLSPTNDIFGQAISTNGSYIDTEFQVNTYTTVDQEDVAVAYNGTDFLVVWDGAGQDGDSCGIYAQLYNSNREPLGSEFRVNSYTTNSQLDPAVASNGKDFFVAWQTRSLSQDYIYVTLIRDVSFVITQQPSSQTADVDDTVQFIVNASTRNGSLHYQWYVNDVISGINSNTLTISGVQMSDNDSDIYCIVSDAKSSIQTDTVKLTVLPPITITQQPVDQSTYEGEPVIFSVAAQSAVPLHYQWYHIKNSMHLPVGADNDTITISDPHLEDDNTQFYCKVSNYAYMETSDNAELSVLEVAFIVKILGNATVYEGTTSEYHAYADYGGGSIYDVTASVQWTIKPQGYADMTTPGFLTTFTVDQDQMITLRAIYDDGTQIHDGEMDVLIDNRFNITQAYPNPDKTYAVSPSSIYITFSESIDPASVTSPTYQLVEPGNDGVFGTVDDNPISLTPDFPVDPASLELVVDNGMLPNNVYQLTIGGIENTDSTVVDGEYSGSFPTGDGTPGGDFIATFTIDMNFISASYNDNDTISLEWGEFDKGVSYVVQYTDSLTPAIWLPVDPQAQWPINSTTWTGDMLDGIQQRFYRAVGAFSFITNVIPIEATQGASALIVHLTGYQTNWNQAVTTVSFGEGIKVSNVTVNDATHITLEILVAISAEPGYRDITVTTGSTVEVKKNGFYINEL